MNMSTGSSPDAEKASLGANVTATATDIHDEGPPIGDRRHRGIGIGILLLLLVGFGGWAVSADLAVAVMAPGRVTAASFKKTVQHLEGGIVERIAVADGELVERGDTLITLDSTRIDGELEIARMQYWVNRATQVRLQAEQADQQRLNYPPALLDQEDRRLTQVLIVQRQLFLARRLRLQSALDALDEQIAQRRRQIEGHEALIDATEQQLASLRKDVKALGSLYQDGFGDNQRLHEMQRDILRYQGELDEHRADIARLRSKVGEYVLQKEVREQKHQETVSDQLREVQHQVADAKERLAMLRDQQRRLNISAPAAGRVVGLAVHTRGAVLDPGMRVLDIVPVGQDFVVKARVTDRDIDHVKIGQPAEVRFTAFNRRQSPLVEGEVQRVSADSFEDEASGEHYYKVRILLKPKALATLPADLSLRSGMPAEVRLQGGERTFASYLFKPVNDMLARAMRPG
ncbi:HlyD family type I secretion periplasmic adaptor subunit [Onishia niordana]|uniref:HlyD family type I secretion periplasmic adaptor subunit n=1 Tax=Onishia niordana TaxID=2508711 RepID=UPI001F0EE4C7|nr:HlyD family type I secretion periplasmic adaptor subunit [Halomonas niordiana]